MVDPEALATRIEREPPSDGVNEDIADAVGWRYHGHCDWRDPTGTRHYELPDWVTSIDAAASLMPEGLDVEVRLHGRLKGWRVVVWGEYSILAQGLAATEPQARAAAALRARAAAGGNNG